MKLKKVYGFDWLVYQTVVASYVCGLRVACGLLVVFLQDFGKQNDFLKCIWVYILDEYKTDRKEPCV